MSGRASKRRRSEHYSGLMPAKGWSQRNLKLLRNHVVPGIFRKRQGETKVLNRDALDSEAVRVTWIGHSGFFVEIGHRKVVIDPNWAKWLGFLKRIREPGLHLHELPKVDLVLVSHAHHDHMHKKSLKILQASHGVVVPTGSATLVKKLGFPAVHEMQVWDQLDFDGLEVTHTPAMHWGARFIHDTHRDYGGFIVKAAGRTVYHCGDSAYFPGFEEIGKRHDIDVALMPIGAYEAPSGRDVHMNPEEAVRAFIELGAKKLIPMHYGTFPLGNEPIDEPVRRLLAEADRLGVAECVMVPLEGEPVIC
jgi:L-ascorbate metabolism protein UlaG (beta-lactamase superfamily)